MSEFKFACPVCGQHITADVRVAGSQLDCPTCFRKLIVPQASASPDSKLVRTAAEASRARSTTGATSTNPPPATGKPLPRLPVLIAAALATIALVGAAGWFAIRPFRPAEFDSNGAHDSADRPRRAVWKLDLSNTSVPDRPAQGRIKGKVFVVERAVLQGGTLNLRTAGEWPPDLGLSIHLYARRPEQLAGKSAVVNTNNIRSPRVVLRWKSNGEPASEVFTNGFALRLEFGDVANGQLPGKIYLCTPDAEQSTIAGTFVAELRRGSSTRGASSGD